MKKEDIIANCIDEIQAGKCTLEDCLARYPSLSDELRPLLKIAMGIQPEAATPSPQFRQRARIRLLQAMQAPAANRGRAGLDIFGWLKPPAPGRRLSYALIVATVVWALIVAGGTTVHASQDSLPDDTLYPVKTAVENLRLAVARTPEARASLHLELAERRVQEVAAQSSLGRTMSTSALEEVAVQTDAAIREIGSIPPEDSKALVGELSKSTVNQQVALGQISEAAPEAAQQALQQALDAARRGNLIAKVAHGNPACLSSLPSVSDEKLEAAYFELEGTLLSAEGGTWNVGGLLLKNVNSPQGTPPIGSRVDIEGLAQADEIFISKIEYEEEIDDQVRIEGVFGGTSSDGTVWYVGGLSIGQPQNIIPPPQGKQVELVGIIQNGAFIVSKVATEEAKKGRVEISGVLVGVNVDESTIAVEVAGAQVTINISKAVIKGADGQPLTLLDLEPLVGRDTKVAHPYVKDGLLYAKEVYVDVEQEARPADEERDDEEDKDKGKQKEEGEDEEQEEDKVKDKGKDKDRGKDNGVDEDQEQADDEEQQEEKDNAKGESDDEGQADDEEQHQNQDKDENQQQEQDAEEERNTRRWWNWWQHHDNDEELNDNEEDEAKGKDKGKDKEKGKP
ncbi:MAG: hypothetical protein H8D32_00620 [Dehalococcoidia bacterium]|nr:hypothetical protein [Dehalococcoidia bacterium]